MIEEDSKNPSNKNQKVSAKVFVLTVSLKLHNLVSLAVYQLGLRPLVAILGTLQRHMQLFLLPAV